MDLKSLIRNVPDFPKPGILFKDITPVLAHPGALPEAIRQMVAPFKGDKIDKVAGLESRGFIFATAIAIELGAGFVPVRKPGKLPYEKISQTYSLEYGTNTLELHTDAVKAGERVLIADDLLATGGTALAARDLILKLGGNIVGFSFLVELAFLEGRKRFDGARVHSVLSY